MKRFVPWLILIVAAAGICWRFPLVHLVSLERATKEKAAATFDPVAFADRFWSEQLLQSLAQATRADVLLAAIRADATAAKQKFSRSVGVSESYTYFLSGTGRVLSADEDAITIAVTPGATNAEVSLQVGLLFGNTVRDATGLLDVSDYPNSQDFNAISEALNHLVETRVQPPLRELAKVGATVRFVGCAEVNDEASDLNPLKVVPVLAQIESPP